MGVDRAADEAPSVDFVLARKGKDFVFPSTSDSLFANHWELVKHCSTGNDIQTCGLDEICLRQTKSSSRTTISALCADDIHAYRRGPAPSPLPQGADFVCGIAADFVQLRWISSLPARARISFTILPSANHYPLIGIRTRIAPPETKFTDAPDDIRSLGANSYKTPRRG